MPHGQVALFSDVRDCPAVPVFDPVGGAEPDRRRFRRVMTTSPTLDLGAVGQNGARARPERCQDGAPGRGG